MDRIDLPGEQASQNQSPTSETLGETPKFGGMLHFLWSRVDAATLSDRELEWLTCHSENAGMTARNLGQTLANVAALVETEIALRDAGETVTGAFGPYGLPGFLCAMGELAETIENSLEVARDAEYHLRTRWESRARALGFKHADNEEKSNG